jgi:hypothetical protein
VLKGAMVVTALWAVPLASAPSRSDRIARVCGGTVDTVNVGSRAPACPPFNIALRERGPLPYKASAFDQGVDQIGFPIPEITFLTNSSQSKGTRIEMLAKEVKTDENSIWWYHIV